MTNEELYNIKSKVKKEFKPIIDEVIFLREQNSQLKYTLDRFREEAKLRNDYIDTLKLCIKTFKDIVGGNYND